MGGEAAHTGLACPPRWFATAFAIDGFSATHSILILGAMPLSAVLKSARLCASQRPRWTGEKDVAPVCNALWNNFKGAQTLADWWRPIVTTMIRSVTAGALCAACS